MTRRVRTRKRPQGTGAPESTPDLAPRTSPKADSDADRRASAAEFRSSLLLVLTADLVALVAWLSWSRRSTPLALLALAAVVIPLVVTVVTKPTLRRTVALLARRETNRVHTVAPVAASVVFASLGLTLGPHAGDLVAASAARHLGPIDELIVSPSADARNQALDALTRARSSDLRVKSSFDDLLPLVLVDGSLRIGERRVGVTVMELDVGVAQAFGGMPSETGLVGFPSLAVGDLGVTQSLLDDTGGVTETALSIGGAARNVRVLPLVQNVGFASVDVFGLASPSVGRDPDRPVVFVAPGTITTAIDALPDAGASANAQFLVAVSNEGDAVAGLRRSSANVTLLEETLANPPVGPVAIPADDPLGLGGSVVSVAAPIEATVIAVKAAHADRLRSELDASTTARLLARAALFTAALACGALAFVARRRRDLDRRETIRTLGLRRRGALAVEMVLLGTSLLIGLVLGALASLVADRVAGPLAPIDPSLVGDPRTLAQAVTIAGGLGVAPSLLRPLARLIPGPMRRLSVRLRSRGLPALAGPVGAAMLIVASVVLLRRRSSLWTLSTGYVALIVGAAGVLGAVVLPRTPFGRRTFARPTRRLRTRCFAGVAAATGLVILPVAASQGLAGMASAAASGSWRSTVSIEDEADAVGLAEQFVRGSGGRVLRVTSLLVDGGGSDRVATPAVALAAGDGLGDAWIPSRTSGRSRDLVDLPPGTAVVSRRLATMRGASLQPGGRVVLRDPITARSISVDVLDVVAFPSWAGDVAISNDVYSGLLTAERVTGSRRAIAVSPMTTGTATTAMRSLAPNATVTVRSADAERASVNGSLVGWLRRVALLTLSIVVALALVFRTVTWRPIHWTVVVAAVAFGALAATSVGGPPTPTPFGPIAVAIALAGLCCIAALRVLTPDVRVRAAVHHLPRPVRSTGEFD